MPDLPVASVLPQLIELLRHEPNLVLQAPPGAGKTTCVPCALFDAGVTGGREVLVAEPRRLAARLAAQHVATERGSALGEQIGYSVRFDSRATRRTRVRYVTYGVLLRRLLETPQLDNVGLVILDEFHERQLSSDLVFALLRHLQTVHRQDLKLLVMSATLDAPAVAHFLDDCPCLLSEGRLFEVRIEHQSGADDRSLAKQITSTVRRALDEVPAGDLLVFVPGASEIRHASSELAGILRSHDLELTPLHGDLSVEQQTRAVTPGRRRKLVLSTNVAESSVTVEGVTVVIDSGLARVARASPWSGLPALTTESISRASAVQRAGRAGRTRPGVVYRLYSRSDFERRPAQDVPEIARTDLTEALLILHGAGVTDPNTLRWLTPPPPAALAGAEQLLRRLEALTSTGRLTEIGRRMLEFPVHPRLARVLVEGERQGVGDDSALAVALLSERDLRAAARTQLDSPRRPADGRGPSDVEELADRFREALSQPHHRVRSLGLDPRAVDAVRRTWTHLTRGIKPGATRERPSTEALAWCLLHGYSDRVARRRERGSPELVMMGGETARLGPQSVVHDAPYLLALDAEDRATRGRSSRALVRVACGIDPDWLLEKYADDITETDELTFNSQTERVERVRRLSYGSVVLDESRGPAPASPATARVLAQAAQARAWDREALDRLAARLQVLAEHFPGLEVPQLTPEVEQQLLAAACRDATTLAELRELPLAELLLTQLTPQQQAELRTHVPDAVQLPGGRRLTVEYAAGNPPWVASRLQDFFGMAAGPSIASGRVPLTLHLLAPNRRAVQVTRDLSGFWSKQYPALRRQLMRRYPKHDWPEDGAVARPPPPGRLRSRQ